MRTARPILIVSVLALVTATSTAGAQSSVTAYVGARQLVDNGSTTPMVVNQANCASQAQVAHGFVSAALASCALTPPVGTGVGSATGLSMFDPTAGAIRSGAAISLNNYTLSQFVGQFDAFGNRVPTYAVRPDFLDVYGSLVLNDRFSVHALGNNAASMSLLFDWNGTFQADQPAGIAPLVTSYAVNDVSFCIAAPGICATNVGSPAVFGGNAMASLTGFGDETFSNYANPPVGAPNATLTFTGTHMPGSVAGVLAITALPVRDRAPLDLFLSMQSQVSFVHASYTAQFNGTGQTDGCDPALDPSCASYAPYDMTGDVSVDFTHSLVLSGFRVYDAAGNDITPFSQLTFASGLTPQQPQVVATPEPASVVLIAAGLAGLLGVARRRRAS